jgi:superfamily II DNA or RNA helicase
MNERIDSASDPCSRLDFLRNVFVLAPEAGESYHETFLIEPLEKKQKPRLFCSCTRGAYARCKHALLLERLHGEYCADLDGKSASDCFRASVWWRVFEQIAHFARTPAAAVSFVKSENEKDRIGCIEARGGELFSYRSRDSNALRLIERVSAAAIPSRFLLMNKGVDFVRSDHERAMHALGNPVVRQVTEENVWFRLAYHCFREAPDGFEPDIRVWEDGQVALTLAAPVFRVTANVTRAALSGALGVLAPHFPSFARSCVRAGNHELYFRVKESAPGTVTLSPAVLVDSDAGVTAHRVTKTMTYNAHVYLPAASLFVKMSIESLKLIATGWNEDRSVAQETISSFIENNIAALSIDSTSPSADGDALNLFSNAGADDLRRIIEPEIITSFDHVELNPLILTADRCTIEIHCVSKGHSLSLGTLIEEKKRKRRFSFHGDAIVDLEAPEVRTLLIASKGIGPGGTLSLARAALLQFRGSGLSMRFKGDEKLVSAVRQMLDFKLDTRIPETTTYTGILRDYQKIGVAWLLYLFDNNFGGLLCDEMGLGKTHQAIAFIAAARQRCQNGFAALIVCPATVVSHWHAIISRFAPSLRCCIYHQGERGESADFSGDVLLTSYGILRNDIDTLKSRSFDIAIFDEAQNIKNPETVSYKAADALIARVKIGMTGTPVENSLGDLKSLFDLTLPGLLDSDDLPQEAVMLGGGSEKVVSQIRRLTAPFILRRMKKAVLSELPPKIEDRRVCSLCSGQRALYQQTLEKRGRPLVETLKNSGDPVPYMHIFSLLNYLKRICDHPALALDAPHLFDSYECGKWELFKELLDETVGSGQKAVVFSHYLGMIEIIRLYLERSGVGHAVLTGASRNRAGEIAAFNENERCRVFVGSLKAGGTGIDLVAGSVVIHYDRWWNAAREDQATDRVHRIGQSRGVQVIKLITADTIEERIDALIEEKRSLADRALAEDAPDDLKQFTREELLELLSLKSRPGE